MTKLPSGFVLNWESQVSWVANVEVVSDSAKLRMTSRNDGIEPVVMALMRGIVMVGEVACAVNGTAAPDLIRLETASTLPGRTFQMAHTSE